MDKRLELLKLIINSDDEGIKLFGIVFMEKRKCLLQKKTWMKHVNQHALKW